MLVGTLFILLVVKSFDQSVNEQRETTKIIHGFPPRKINDIHVNAHKVYKLCADLYHKPSLKSKIKKKLSFGSKIKITEKKANFY